MEKTRKLAAWLEASLLSQNGPLLTQTTPTNNPQKLMKYKPKVVSYGLSLLTATVALIGVAGPLQAQEKKPNILFIMGDDIGWMQPSCYHRGLMVGERPNIDRIAHEGECFMHNSAPQHCTAG